MVTYRAILKQHYAAETQARVEVVIGDDTCRLS